MNLVCVIAFLVLCLAALPASAGTVLFDFEKDADVSIWHNEGTTTLGADKNLERSEQFATSGKNSMRFATPAWRPQEHRGASKWPAFECKPPLADWSKYDRLIMDLLNTTAARQRVMLFISDSKKATRLGLIHTETLEPLGYSRSVIDLRKGVSEKGVDLSDIGVMHFFTENPPADMVVHFDNFLLLEPGEDLPPVPVGFINDFASLHTHTLDEMRSQLAEAQGRLKQKAKGNRAVMSWVMDSVSNWQKRLSNLEERLKGTEESVLRIPQELAETRTELASLESEVSARMEFEAIRPSVQSGKQAPDDVLVGFATSMEKILPRAGTPLLKISKRADLSLAQNEKEAFQVVVLPMRRNLKQVRLRVRDLCMKSGTRFPTKSIAAVAVGYVQTKAIPPYGTSHVGWWPDPILNFMDTVDIAKGDAQAFWVRVRAPKGQTPGTYNGKLDVLLGGKTAFSFDLSLRVRDFEMPDASPLPLAITFSPEHFPTDATQAEQAEWRKSETYPVNAWKKHKMEWPDLLADYYFTYDSLYHHGVPDFEILSHLNEQGRLGYFNLGYYGPTGGTPEEVETWKKDTLPRLREGYEKAKAAGVLDHAYIYGCDENPAELFPLVQKAAEILKKEFPEVPVMTTTYDHSFGLETVIKSVDWWCPLTPSMNKEQADKARAAGKQVWWYICCGPHHPFANMFIEYPAIEGRLLMGAMSAKYRPDGFLYYQISIWNSQKPIESGPFTDWDPRSWTTYHGDGSWACVGPGGKPLPTIRMENFRDGLEDYAYYRILEATLAKVEA
ncbi:MAG: DUF4091 domain-containing protein, partial [Armatimonadetes bacterium]|nr:DUF4091 domain-containing protein [Armatimonadota bacterium]